MNEKCGNGSQTMSPKNEEKKCTQDEKRNATKQNYYDFFIANKERDKELNKMRLQ